MDSFSLSEKLAMNEASIQTVKEYIEQIDDDPCLIWWECKFKSKSYSKWAANEILERLMSDPITLPFLIVVYFYNQMDYFLALSSDKKISQTWAIARDTAEEILNLIN